MGNDEHSQNVFRRAKEQGLDPLAYCDRMEQEFREAWSRLDVAFDDFIRTTEPRHKAAVQKMVQASLDRGDIYQGEYEGWYCVSCEEFKPEKSLVDGLCPVHRTKPDWIKEKNWFFKLSGYGSRLLQHYEEHPDFVAPESRRNEMLSLIEGGLDDISVSRAGQSWGIPLPNDPTSVVYVWYDALINYITAAGYGTDAALFDTWWQTSDTRLHIVGKDITRFHCVIWPAMLMSAGLQPPTQVFGHGWMMVNGQKMSKSLGTMIDPIDAANRLGADPLRWYLAREVVFGQDGDFSSMLFEKSYNADLANNLGNLVNRITSMAHRYRGGVLHGPGLACDNLRQAEDTCRGYSVAFARHDLARAGAGAFWFVDQANELIAKKEPWKLAKTGDDGGLDAVLWNASEALRIAAILLTPFMPASCAEILRRIGVGHDVAKLRWHPDTTWQINGERTLQQGPLLWPRVEADKAIEISTKETRVTDHEPPRPEAGSTGAASPAAPASPALPAQPASPAAAAEPAAPTPVPASLWPMESRITIDDFLKIDLRIARVLTAERVPKSNKLIKLTIDLGSEQRTLVAGIAEAYDADALVGRHVAIVANLKPAKLMGIESNGMVLAASPEGGKPMLVSFDQPPPPGSRVR
jgi:methionyl-tRNA synthetase